MHCADKCERLTIRISGDLKRQVANLARRADRSESYVARAILETAFNVKSVGDEGQVEQIQNLGSTPPVWSAS